MLLLPACRKRREKFDVMHENGQKNYIKRDTDPLSDPYNLEIRASTQRRSGAFSAIKGGRMKKWNAEQYLMFKDERTQPAKDLASLGRTFDVVFSNACIQWIPDHERLIQDLMNLLNQGGVLAVQIPMIWDEPLHKELKALAASDKWTAEMRIAECFFHLRYEEYYDVLARNSTDFRAWETVYLHRMPSHESILDWYRGTAMLPYLSALPENKKHSFEQDYLARLKDVYAKQKNGEILFRFPRFFFVAIK